MLSCLPCDSGQPARWRKRLRQKTHIAMQHPHRRCGWVAPCHVERLNAWFLNFIRMGAVPTAATSSLLPDHALGMVLGLLLLIAAALVLHLLYDIIATNDARIRTTLARLAAKGWHAWLSAGTEVAEDNAVDSVPAARLFWKSRDDLSQAPTHGASVLHGATTRAELERRLNEAEARAASYAEEIGRLQSMLDQQPPRQVPQPAELDDLRELVAQTLGVAGNLSLRLHFACAASPEALKAAEAVEIRDEIDLRAGIDLLAVDARRRDLLADALWLVDATRTDLAAAPSPLLLPPPTPPPRKNRSSSSEADRRAEVIGLQPEGDDDTRPVVRPDVVLTPTTPPLLSCQTCDARESAAPAHIWRLPASSCELVDDDDTDDTDIIDVTDVDFDSSSPESLAHVIKSFTPVPFDSVSTPTASPTLLRPKPLSSGTPSGSGSRTRARVRTALASAKSRLAMARSFRTVATDLAEAVVVPLRQTPVRSLARGGS